jgi:hypothetical protein
MADSTSFAFSNEHCTVKVDADKNGRVDVGHGHGVDGRFGVHIHWGPKRVMVFVDGVEMPITINRIPRGT